MMHCMGLIIKLITLWFVLGQFDSDFNGVFTVVPLQIYIGLRRIATMITMIRAVTYIVEVTLRIKGGAEISFKNHSDVY